MTASRSSSWRMASPLMTLAFGVVLMVSVSLMLTPLQLCGASLASSSATNTSATNTTAPVLKSWTVMVYLMGDNQSSRFAQYALREMLANTNKNVRFCILGDLSSVWSNIPVSDAGTIYYLSNPLSTQPETSNLGEKNLDDPLWITAMINSCASTTPAEVYSLFFWEHGSGYVLGGDENSRRRSTTASDNNDDNSDNEKKVGRSVLDVTQRALFLDEITAAIGRANITFFEAIGFDSGLMANWFVLDMLSPYTNYVIASQEVEPSHGWDWSAFQSIAAGTTGGSLGREIGRRYVRRCNERETYGCTLSVMNTTYVQPLAGALVTLVNDMRAHPCEIRPARLSTYSFGKLPGGDPGSYVDLVQLCDSLSPSGFFPVSCPRILTAVGQLVSYQFGTDDMEFASGISMPFFATTAAWRNAQLALQHINGPHTSNWLSFINDLFGGRLPGAGNTVGKPSTVDAATLRLLNQPPPTAFTSDGVYTVLSALQGRCSIIDAYLHVGLQATTSTGGVNGPIQIVASRAADFSVDEPTLSIESYWDSSVVSVRMIDPTKETTVYYSTYEIDETTQLQFIIPFWVSLSDNLNAGFYVNNYLVFAPTFQNVEVLSSTFYAIDPFTFVQSEIDPRKTLGYTWYPLSPQWDWQANRLVCQ